MSEKHTLTAEPRQVTGRKVKQIRQQGLAPANIFGSQIRSLAIQLPQSDFLDTYQEVGDTGLIYLKIQGEKDPRPALVHLIQTDPVKGNLIHIDFRQVDLKAKITAHVPVELTGESPAAEQHGGILVHDLDEVEVEALPTDFPESIEIDISTLKEIGESLHVSDLKIDTKKLTILTDSESIVAHVEAPKEEEEESPAPSPDDVEVTEEAKDDSESEESSDQESAPDTEQGSEESK